MQTSAPSYPIVKLLTGLVRGILSLKPACFTSQESCQEAWMMEEFAMQQSVLNKVKSQVNQQQKTSDLILQTFE